MSATLERILLRLVRMSLRIGPYVADPPAMQALLRELGFEAPNGFPAAEIEAAMGAALEVFEQFRGAPAADERSVSGIAEAAAAVGEIVLAVGRLADAMDARLPQDFLNASGMAERLPRRLLDWLAIEDLLENQPAIYQFLRLAGLIEMVGRSADAARFQPEFTERRVRWDRFIVLFSDPFGAARERYGWGQPGFDTAAILVAARDLLRTLGVPADMDLADATGTDPALRIPLLSRNQDEMLLAATLSAAEPFLPGGGPGLKAALEWAANLDVEIEIEPGFTLAVRLETTSAGRLEATVRPESGPEVVLAGGGANADAGRYALEFVRGRADEVLPLLTVSRALRLECMGLRWAVGVKSAGGDSELFAEVGIRGGALRVSAAGGDGFLQSLLPVEGALPFDLTVGLGSEQGLYVNGSGGLEAALGLHETIGFVAIEVLYLGLLASDRNLAFEAAATGRASLGPIALSVDRLGLRLRLEFGSGNLGPLGLDVGFKPPNGLGLVIDAGPITGGGFIGFDEPAGRYAGVVELDLSGIGVAAIGVLDTKDVTGRPLPPPGYSFLLAISARFQGLQLGFGFTLNAVGGLIGIHRAMALEQLRSGVREGSLDPIMFPEDPVRNMPRVLGELGAFFPPANNRFVFGPMAEVGWGTPTLFEMEVGVIMELPAPVLIALLGQINVALPTKDTDIVALHVAILGVLDFGKKLLSIDASLYDSRIALFSVSGDVAMRLAWGDPPNFALSVGGLNPGFQPPPGFPALRRVTVSLGLGDNPRISLQGYLAVTSNSIQFGAAAELYAAAWELNIYGWLKFDALVVFDPFFFSFEFSVGFALRWDETTFAGIALTGLVSGPSPFHIRGRACISILFVDICVGFDVAIGERQPVVLPEKDPWPVLKAAIADPGNWSSVLALDLLPAVRLREPAGAGPVLVPPMGLITLRQKVLPLNSRLDKFGEFRIPGEARFDVDAALVGGNPVPWEPVRDYFAPGQFEALSNAEKLSGKSFEKMDAGVRLAAAGLAAGRAGSARIAQVNYQTAIVDEPGRRGRPADGPALARSAQVALSSRGAKAYSALRGTGSAKYATPHRAAPFAPAEEEYGIADTEARALRPEFGTALSKPLARQRLEAHLARHPEDRGYLQVLPLAELEAEA